MKSVDLRLREGSCQRPVTPRILPRIFCQTNRETLHPEGACAVSTDPSHSPAASVGALEMVRGFDHQRS